MIIENYHDATQSAPLPSLFGFEVRKEPFKVFDTGLLDGFVKTLKVRIVILRTDRPHNSDSFKSLVLHEGKHRFSL